MSIASLNHQSSLIDFRLMKRIIGLLAGLLTSVGTLAHSGPVPDVEGALPLTRLTENIYVVHGPQVFPNVETQGFMNNPGFVITSAGVVVVDPGGSLQIGQKLIASIRSITDLPVVAVFNTHVHGDHWLGNQAIQEAYPDVSIYAHKNMIKRIESGEGEEWIELFDRMTSGATKGTRVVFPNISLHGNEVVNIGDVSFKLHHPQKAHSDTDLIIEVTNEKSVFAGDILANHRVQSARPQDSDILGQIEAVKFILNGKNDIFIPGHGLSGGRDIAVKQLKFLTDLYRLVKKYYRQDLDAFELTPLVKREMSAYSNWHNFNELGRVIDAVYLRVEQDEFNN